MTTLLSCLASVGISLVATRQIDGPGRIYPEGLDFVVTKRISGGYKVARFRGDGTPERSPRPIWDFGLLYWHPRYGPILIDPPYAHHPDGETNLFSHHFWYSSEGYVLFSDSSSRNWVAINPDEATLVLPSDKGDSLAYDGRDFWGLWNGKLACLTSPQRGPCN